MHLPFSADLLCASLHTQKRAFLLRFDGMFAWPLTALICLHTPPARSHRTVYTRYVRCSFMWLLLHFFYSPHNFFIWKNINAFASQSADRPHLHRDWRSRRENKQRKNMKDWVFVYFLLCGAHDVYNMNLMAWRIWRNARKFTTLTLLTFSLAVYFLVRSSRKKNLIETSTLVYNVCAVHSPVSIYAVFGCLSTVAACCYCRLLLL